MLTKKLLKKDKELWWKFEKHSTNPGIRIWARVEPLVDEFMEHGTKKEQEEIQAYASKLKEIKKIVDITYVSRNILFILAYISFFSVLLGNLALLGELVKVAGYVSGVIGAALLVVLVTILDKFISLYIEDMQISSSHIISIYHKYRPKDRKIKLNAKKNIK